MTTQTNLSKAIEDIEGRIDDEKRDLIYCLERTVADIEKELGRLRNNVLPATSLLGDLMCLTESQPAQRASSRVDSLCATLNTLRFAAKS